MPPPLSGGAVEAGRGCKKKLMDHLCEKRPFHVTKPSQDLPLHDARSRREGRMAPGR